MRLSSRDLAMQETVTSVLSKRMALLLVAVFMFYTACGELSDFDSERVRSAMHDSLLASTESWDVSMTLLELGHRRIMIEGSYAITYNDDERKETRIDGPVYVQIYDSSGTMESEAWSKRAVYHAEDREFELFDSVRVETVRNRQLYSDYLRWAERTDRITSDRFVTIITPTDSISGSGFDGRTDLTDYVITDLSGRVIVD
jgi:LPS export ABC transporter protein LptC